MSDRSMSDRGMSDGALQVSTGIPNLDRLFGDGRQPGLLPGDNVVFTVDSIDSYVPFARTLSRYVTEAGLPLVYFRFAQHPPVLEPDPRVEVIATHPEPGFESFITQIHSAIRERAGVIYYVFDSLSDLSHTCYSDRMIGNFFRLTCPFLRDLDTVAYFALYRHFHSYHAVEPIRRTTQILLDIWEHEGLTYLQPQKIDERLTPSNARLHLFRNERFEPVTSSARISAVIQSSGWPGLPSASYRMIGVWDKTFVRAEQVLSAPDPDTVRETLLEVLRLIITNDDRMLVLAERYFTLADVIGVWKRMIGTGMIGGKAVGMLLARAILRSAGERWARLLEPHDSFYIGSDVYYTFLVTNDCWWDRQRQKDPESFLDGNDAVRAKFLAGSFPDYIVARFADMLDYFDEAPIIVRSSSLLEDNFGNAFSGKYDSVFCVNRGSPEERLAAFMDAVRTIYASTISDEALSYRAMRGVLDRDEQMALLVQRVSGAPYGRYFLPQLAGVAYSFNPYAWSREIEPDAGMLRLVFGLGTRAVDRTDDDYTRVVSLSAPGLRPDASADDRRRHAQRRVDVLDRERNEFRQVHFLDIVRDAADLPVDAVATRDRALSRELRERGLSDRSAYVLTLDPILEKTTLVSDMRELLSAIREAYGTHVDLEFTANLDVEWGFTIDVLQCRPLQVQGTSANADPVPDLPPDRIVLRSEGGVIGHSRTIDLDRIVYVVPGRYAALSEPKRYELARLVGRLVKATGAAAARVMIVGPGRWGTSTPSLGIPVSFSEINTVSVLCEIDSMHEGLVPDLSLGTHFFNDLVEQNILYVGHFGGNRKNVLGEAYFTADPGALERLAPQAAEWRETVFVREFGAGGGRLAGGGRPCLYANALEQLCVVYTTP